MKMGQCSETAFKLQTPVNHPEESIQHSEHSESLKSIWELLIQPKILAQALHNPKIQGKWDIL
jgi:hypothetical protein